jgi:hypothetical protein
MKKTTISVTEAARNFADCVNRAHYQNVTFVLLKNGEPFARLTPDNEKECAGRDLAKALASVKKKTLAKTSPLAKPARMGHPHTQNRRVGHPAHS